jgi:hypothetical protein
MKKTTVIALVISGLLLASCGRSGWNCKNRYCNAPEKSQKHKTIRPENDRLPA